MAASDDNARFCQRYGVSKKDFSSAIAIMTATIARLRSLNREDKNKKGEEEDELPPAVFAAAWEEAQKRVHEMYMAPYRKLAAENAAATRPGPK